MLQDEDVLNSVLFLNFKTFLTMQNSSGDSKWYQSSMELSQEENLSGTLTTAIAHQGLDQGERQ